MRIENEELSVEASLHGGSLTSVFDRRSKREWLYQPVEGSWKGQDIFQFPFVARLEGGTYETEGKTYSLRNHGVLRYVDFQGKKESSQAMELSFASNAGTLEEFPYSFRASVRYQLEGRKMTASYRVVNDDVKPFFFGCGCHPAFAVPGTPDENGQDIAGSRIEFPEEAELYVQRTDPEGKFMTGEEFQVRTKRSEERRVGKECRSRWSPYH